MRTECVRSMRPPREEALRPASLFRFEHFELKYLNLSKSIYLSKLFRKTLRLSLFFSQPVIYEMGHDLWPVTMVTKKKKEKHGLVVSFYSQLYQTLTVQALNSSDPASYFLLLKNPRCRHRPLEMNDARSWHCFPLLWMHHVYWQDTGASNIWDLRVNCHKTLAHINEPKQQANTDIVNLVISFKSPGCMSGQNNLKVNSRLLK